MPLAGTPMSSTRRTPRYTSARRSGAYSALAQSRSRSAIGSAIGSSVSGRGANTTPGTPRGSYSASAPGKYKRPNKKTRKAMRAQAEVARSSGMNR